MQKSCTTLKLLTLFLSLYYQSPSSKCWFLCFHSACCCPSVASSLIIGKNLDNQFIILQYEHYWCIHWIWSLHWHFVPLISSNFSIECIWHTMLININICINSLCFIIAEYSFTIWLYHIPLYIPQIKQKRSKNSN